MAMTTNSIRGNLGEVARLEERLRFYEAQMKFYQNEMVNNHWLTTEEYLFVKRKAKEYEQRFTMVCTELRELKIKLRGKYNMDAYSYDSPYLVDDSYYEKKFKTDGYFVAIKF